MEWADKRWHNVQDQELSLSRPSPLQTKQVTGFSG